MNVPGKYQELKRRLELVRAVYDRPGSEGEKQAAALAIQRLLYKMESLQTYERAVIRKPEWVVFRKV